MRFIGFTSFLNKLRNHHIIIYDAHASRLSCQKKLAPNGWHKNIGDQLMFGLSNNASCSLPSLIFLTKKRLLPRGEILPLILLHMYPKLPDFVLYHF